MAFDWDPNWNGKDKGFDNNNGCTQAEIVTILSKAAILGTGDAGLLQALSGQDAKVKILKGVHQEGVNKNPHITVEYLGGVWHVDLLTTAMGGKAGYRVGKVAQWKA